MKEVELINKNFITEQRNKLEIRVKWKEGWFILEVIKSHRYLGKVEIPDCNYNDVPLIDGDQDKEQLNKIIIDFVSKINELKKP